MKIAGIQKTALIDYPGKIACTIFLYGCDFRCGFCHNPELVIENIEESKIISEEEVLDFLEKRKNQLEGVCITGGEPLLSLEKEFLERIKKIGYLIKLDTNGSFPEKLREFVSEGLVDFVAMDVKGPREVYNSIANCDIDMRKIEESLVIISRLENYEFRTTIVSEIHDKENVKDMLLWVNGVINRKPRKFVLQGFQNHGKFIDKKFERVKNVEEDFLNEIKEEIKDLVEVVEVRV